MFKLFIPRGEKILHLVWSVNRADFLCLIYMFDTNFSRLATFCFVFKDPLPFKLNCQIVTLSTAPLLQVIDVTLRGAHRSCEEHCLNGCEKLKCQA